MADATSPESVMAQAQALIEQVQRDLEAGDALFRELGIDPGQARATLEAQMTPEMREQARQAFEKDRQEAEDRFREELARTDLAQPARSTKPTRRARFMV